MPTTPLPLVQAAQAIQGQLMELHRSLDTTLAVQDQAQVKAAYDAIGILLSRWLYQVPS